MPTERHSQRIVIAGASSLLGSELKSVLEESRFGAWDFRLVDEDAAAGTLTEAGGEAALIQRVDEETFHGARYAFLAGSTDFGRRCLEPAREAGATVIDFSRASLSDPDATPWFPKIEQLTGRSLAKTAKTFCVVSAAGTAVTSLTLGLRGAGLQGMVAMVYQSASEAGREGIEELETQTSQLLSFQSVGHPVFGTQAAFNLLPRYGQESRQDLRRNLLAIRAEVSAALHGHAENQEIAVNLVHAPVFYGMVFSACADLEGNVDAAALAAGCKQAGFAMVEAETAAPSNVSVAGETCIFLRSPEEDEVRRGSWWFWGAADNLRLPAWNGCKLAEWLDG